MKMKLFFLIIVLLGCKPKFDNKQDANNPAYWLNQYVYGNLSSSVSATTTGSNGSGTGTGTSSGTSSGNTSGIGTTTVVTPAACIASGATNGTMSNLNFSVVDAEYDLVNDRIVIVDSNNKFHYYNPSNNTDTITNLNFAPLNVTVSPDGTKAAVGHDLRATLIDLPSGTIAREVTTPIKAFDIALNNTHAYISSSVYSWGNLRSVNFSTGVISSHTGNTLYPTNLILNQSGNSIYVIENGLFPADIDKVNVATEPPAYLYDSPYHGDHALFPPLWIARNSTRLFNSRLTTFSLSGTQVSDIIFANSMSSTGLFRIQHLSTDNAKILLIASNVYFGATTDADKTKDSSEYLYQFNLSNLAFVNKIVLPCTVSNSTQYRTSGKFVFISNSGVNHFVIATPDISSGLINDVIIRF